jgi:hypothetical protein
MKGTTLTELCRMGREEHEQKIKEKSKEEITKERKEREKE